MFIDALFYQFCSFLCWNWGFSPFTHYIFLCPFFCFLKFISGTTWRSFLIFYQNLRGHLINKEAERVFEKNIFLGILGQKDPKWALREACQVLLNYWIKDFVLVFSANKGPKWALKIDPKSFSDFLNKITVAWQL